MRISVEIRPLLGVANITLFEPEFNQELPFHVRVSGPKEICIFGGKEDAAKKTVLLSLPWP